MGSSRKSVIIDEPVKKTEIGNGSYTVDFIDTGDNRFTVGEFIY